MSDLPAVSAGEPTESRGLPTPQISEVSAGQPTSPAGDANAVEELRREMREMRETLPTLVERGVRATKDRRFEAVLKAADEVAVVKKYLEAAGGDAERAAKEMWIDAQMRGQVVSQQSDRGGTEVEDFDERYAGILAKHGIASDDTELAEWVGSTKFGSRNAFLNALREQAERLKSKREKQAAPVTAASLGVGSEGAPQGEKGEAQLIEDYRKEMLAARGKPAEVRAIKDRYKEKGVPVQNVIF